MVQKPDIQYIHNFYVHGSEAKVLELKPKKKITKTQLPLVAPDTKIHIAIDPLAICGILVTVVMVILMTVGVFQYVDAYNENQAMADHVIELQNENISLEQTYRGSYDLADIEGKALALGMVPASEAEVITIQIQIPEAEAEITWWEDLCWYFSGFFA